VEVTLERVTASLHCDGDGVLWAKTEADRPFFSRIGDAALFAARTRVGPSIIAGGFDDPASIEAVRVENEEFRLDAAVVAEGWICLIPSAAVGQLKITFLDASGTELATSELPPLGDAGFLGPTMYGPPRE
jgi:hypothetical protein